MEQTYKAGEIYKITLADNRTSTYVALVPHMDANKLAFRSLIAKENGPAIPIEQLAHYSHEYICTISGPKQDDLLEEMVRNKPLHLRIWELFDAEGWDRSDRMSIELGRMGVVTNKPGTLFE